ncbi:VOC family protein [Bradyrhizobium cajani]|uniref:VOC family protein n=1 Tax=Bradyrhizobium cajani TaxID=1928661 RepID=A0A844TRB9_9BRAD|nr:VOC family protein [Bradyrhizobium cajani]MCP3371273.1 VOC family protein [Bradyrhizobium cajani]MVT77070.1 VOC family protein [Bradyrhizobium cajani]
MIAPRAAFDHLTVAALSLEEGVAHVHRCLGVAPPPGGSHPLMATHNHLMQLGDGAFLEIIAPDLRTRPRRTRWFDLDNPAMRSRLEETPRLINWVVRVPNLGKALSDLGEDFGEPVPVARGSLAWLISVRPDGVMSFDGAFPTLIEWPASPHPSEHMTDLGCRLDRLSIEHPGSAAISNLLAPIIADDRIVVADRPAVRIRATIATPSGPRELT